MTGPAHKEACQKDTILNQSGPVTVFSRSRRDEILGEYRPFMALTLGRGLLQILGLGTVRSHTDGLVRALAAGPMEE
jgi:hypothetical protein